MKTNKTEVALLDEIEAEFSVLESDFGDLGLEDGDASVSSELKDFEAALAGTEFSSESAESEMGSTLTILQIADGETPDGGEEGWLGDAWKTIKRPVVNIVKRKAKKIIARLTKLIRKYAKYRACIPAVTLAVAAFKAGKYGTALKQAYAAYRCIRAHS